MCMKTFQLICLQSNCQILKLFSPKVDKNAYSRCKRAMTTSSSLNNCKFISQKEIASGKWLSLNKITYTNHKGKEREWEAVNRTTTQGGFADAVVIIPILKRMLKYDCLVFVKQFRPPMKCCTIEFPAGLIDKGETADESALRELKEETGYSGNTKHKSPVTCLDPGVGNCTVSMVTVEIDGDDPVNKDVSPNPDESEYLEVLLIPIEQVIDKLNDLSEEGHVIDSRCYSYAIGIEQTRKYLKKISQM